MLHFKSVYVHGLRAEGVCFPHWEYNVKTKIHWVPWIFSDFVLKNEKSCIFFLVLLEYNWCAVLCFYCTAKWSCYTYICSFRLFPIQAITEYWVEFPVLYSRFFSSVARLCPTLCDPMDCSTPGLPVHHQLLELTQTHVHWVGDAIQPSHPLLSPSPPAFSLSQHRVFSNESVLLIRWPKYWSFSFRISPSNEYSGLISFRMDWLDLLAVQGTLKSLLQYHSSKASILWPSAFFIVQLLHPYMTKKTIALTRRIFAGKVSAF